MYIMSQSDFIQRKKMANILKKGQQKSLGNTMDSKMLIGIKSFVYANHIENHNVRRNQLVPEGKQRIFGMEVNSIACKANCPNYNFGNGTRNRENRSDTIMPLCSHYRSNISKNAYFIEQKENNLLCLEKVFEECDDFFDRKSVIRRKA